MLLGYADIEAARGMHRRELVEARPGRHGGGDRDDLVVEARLLRERVREDGGIGGGVGFGFRLSPGNHVEFVDAVILVGRGFGRRIALALLRDHMDQDGAFRIVANVAQDRKQVVEGVSVDRADMVETHLLE